MRTLLFRDETVVAADVYHGSVVVTRRDLDGVQPAALFLETKPVHASVRTRWGSKNANLRFVAVEAGDDGNGHKVQYRVAANQAFTVEAPGEAGDPWVVKLPCDGDGRPLITAASLMDTLNAHAGFSAVLRAVLARGSDGGAAAVDFDDIAATSGSRTFETAGGVDAAQTGPILVQSGISGDGPWVTEVAYPYGIGEEEVVRHLPDSPIHWLRVLVDAADEDVPLQVSAVRSLPR